MTQFGTAAPSANPELHPEEPEHPIHSWLWECSSVFGRTVMAASMSCRDSNRFPLKVILTLGKSQRSHIVRSSD